MLLGKILRKAQEGIRTQMLGILELLLVGILRYLRLLFYSLCFRDLFTSWQLNLDRIRYHIQSIQGG